MSMTQTLQSRRNRVRATISGTPERPRLVATITLKHITAQVIDDTTGKTLAHATSVSHDVTGTMTERATKIGAEIAEKAKKAGISKVVFDRAGRIYHGRLAALATAAREKGLDF
jgi:large subunit ribosomal protein L18